MDMECWLDVSRRVECQQVGQHREIELSLSVLDHQSLEAVLAKDMEAVEHLWVFEGIEADSTGQLVLQLLEGLLGYSLRFSHTDLD